jgi:acetyl-CoA carboxylase carboxyl transferase subunit beta
MAVVAFERGHRDSAEAHHHGRPRPAGYRKAQRVLRLASRLRLAVLTIVDTPGAYPGIESEEGGLAGEIARTLELMISLPVPIVSAVIGEGGSGGALALAVSDRLVMQAGAFFSVIAPEGAAAILYRDAARAPELAEKLKITADDLLAYGIVDAVVAEPPAGAAADLELASDYLRESIVEALNAVAGKRTGKLLKQRRARYRQMGSAFVTTSPPRSPRPASEEPPKAISAA